VIVLEVHGKPAPKGSARAMLIGGKPRLIASSSGRNETDQSRWSKVVREAALAQHDRFADTPLAVSIVFRLRRPVSHFRTGRNATQLRDGAPAAPLTNPDVDKLVRCTLDALVDTVSRGREYPGIVDDDARIVVIKASKVYASSASDEGATIMISPWDEMPF